MNAAIELAADRGEDRVLELSLGIKVHWQELSCSVTDMVPYSFEVKRLAGPNKPNEVIRYRAGHRCYDSADVLIGFGQLRFVIRAI